MACNAGLSDAAGLTTVVIAGSVELPAVANLKVVRIGASTAVDELHRAIRGAARSHRHLAVVLDSILPANEVLAQLIEEFDRDPLFGMAQPRFSDAATDHISPLPDDGAFDTPHPGLTRTGLSFLPDCTITPEFLSACMVIRREVVKEIDRGDFGIASITGELRLLLCQARRRGFCNLVVNRAVLSSDLLPARLYPLPPNGDMERLRTMYPEIVKADAWRANLSQCRLEMLLGRVYANDVGDRRRLLLDCRGMISQHNGTSHSILGFLDGFDALDTGWQIDILVPSAVGEFFQLQKRYQKLGLVLDRPQGTYTAAVLLNQPWALSRVAELHRHALLVAFNMLDTISWDILYVRHESLDSLWRFVARFSDGLLYNSQFTRDRFTTRFPLQARIAECVTYHSLAAEEQVDQAALQEPVGDYIFVIGNNYDHKDMRRTLQILGNAFPFNKIVAIGIEGTETPNVVTMPSGQIEEMVLQRLIAGARVIVSPSFYEGFGMPVVQGLAYGRPVIVRESPLWHEIAGQLQMPGAMVTFDDTASLVEAVGRILAGLPLDPLPQGKNLRDGEPPLRWRDCAQRVIGLVEELLCTADGRRWREREEALRAIQVLQS